MPAGTVATLTVVNSLVSGHGVFAKEGTVYINGEERELVRGFVTEDESIGTVEAVPTSQNCVVKYRQLSSRENRVYFYADTGEIQTISIVHVPIHDHSTIFQGGPAYGTYFAEVQDEDDGGANT